MAIGHDQTQFEIPVVDHIVDKTMDGLNLRNPVATDLLSKGIWFFNLFAITSFLISIITLFQSIKVGCVFPMVIIPILPRAEFGPNDHREDAAHFIYIPMGKTIWKPPLVRKHSL